MKRSLNKGRRLFRYRPNRTNTWRSLERFHAMGLRLAGFLHQFKTPLHVIQSQAELLLEDAALSPENRRSLDMIFQNAGRLSAQTQAMMNAARGGEETFQAAPVEKLVEDICHAAEADCRKKNITFEKEISVVGPIRMDALALEGALHNLVNNAIEAAPAGGCVSVKTVSVSPRRVGVVIADTGKGMDPKTLARVIHTPFQTSKANGTGLGLYITRHILKRHHASVRWQSKPGEGTKVTVLFPRVRNI